MLVASRLSCKGLSPSAVVKAQTWASSYSSACCVPSSCWLTTRVVTATHHIICHSGWGSDVDSCIGDRAIILWRWWWGWAPCSSGVCLSWIKFRVDSHACPQTCQNLLKCFSFFTTLDGGMVKGFVGIPQVECAFAVHLQCMPEKCCYLVGSSSTPIQHLWKKSNSGWLTVLLDRLLCPVCDGHHASLPGQSSHNAQG